MPTIPSNIYLHLSFDAALPTLPASKHRRYLSPGPNLGRLGSPRRCGPARKSVVLAVSCLTTFWTAYAAGAYVPPAGAMARGLGTSRLVVLGGVTTFCAGFAVAPMALAPMALAPISETWGRRAVLLVAGVVFVLSQAAFSWGILYLSLAVVPFLDQTDLDRAGRVYAAIIAAAAAAAAAVSIVLERLLRIPQWRAHGDGFRYADSRFWALPRRRLPPQSPESRLYFACVTAVFLPGLFGAFMAPRDHDGSTEVVGLGFATFGVYFVYLSSFSYLADAYPAYASSALAAHGFCRSITGGAFPLLTRSNVQHPGAEGRRRPAGWHCRGPYLRAMGARPLRELDPG